MRQVPLPELGRARPLPLPLPLLSNDAMNVPLGLFFPPARASGVRVADHFGARHQLLEFLRAQLDSILGLHFRQVDTLRNDH